MSRFINISLYSLFLATSLFLENIGIAQDLKIVTGLSLTGLPNSGCVSDFQPPKDPGYPNAIRCSLNIKSDVTYRGEAGLEGKIGGVTKVSGPELSTFKDDVGNTYTHLLSTYNANPCAGTGCYAEYRTDNAPRSFYNEISIQTERLKAINGNPLVKSIFAYNISADGMMISHELEGEKNYFDVNENEIKKIEIFITDHNGRNSLTQRTEKSPYRIEWVQPNLSRTPHKERVDAITFESRYDIEAGRWRFFMALDGTRFPRKGIYIVNYNVVEENPVKVEYLSKVEGLLTFNHRRVNQAVLTVGVGIQSCVQGSLGFPDIVPHNIEVNKFIKKVKSKTGSKLIAKIRGAAEKREIRELGRSAGAVAKMYKNLVAINSRLIQGNILTIDGQALTADTAALDETISRIVGNTKSFKKGSENLGRISTVVRRFNKSDKKFVKAIKKLELSARSTGAAYLETLRSAMLKRSQISSSMNQCELDQSVGQ